MADDGRLLSDFVDVLCFALYLAYRTSVGVTSLWLEFMPRSAGHAIREGAFGLTAGFRLFLSAHDLR